MQEGLKTNNVWGVLPGLTDENILVMAHHDAFFDGALNNASGMAMLLEIAKYYAAIAKSERRRTMVFLDDAAPFSRHGRFHVGAREHARFPRQNRVHREL